MINAPMTCLTLKETVKSLMVGRKKRYLDPKVTKILRMFVNTPSEPQAKNER